MASKISDTTLLPLGLVASFLAASIAVVLTVASYFYDTKANAKAFETLELRVTQQEKLSRETREQILIDITEIKSDIRYIKNAVK